MLALEAPALVAGADEGIRVIALGLAGRREEARTALLRMRRAHIPAFQCVDRVPDGVARAPRPDMLASMSVLHGLKIRDDPEAIFQEGRFLCDVGEHRLGVEHLRRAVSKGYWVLSTLQHAREFDAVRGDRDFTALVADAAAGRDRALAAFREAGGERLLGRGAQTVESAATGPNR